MIDPNKEPITRFWKGTDVRTKEGVILNPGLNTVPLHVTADNLPPIRSLETLRSCRPTVRSRYAQLGVDIEPNVISEFLKDLRTQPDLFKSPNDSFESRAMVVNHSLRPVSLPPSIQLFRLFKTMCPHSQMQN